MNQNNPPLPWVTLNDVDQEIAHIIAKHRHEYMTKNHDRSRKVSDRDSLDVNLDGIGAELCQAKMYNLYPDTDVSSWKEEDMFTHEGIAVDAKSTPYETGGLMVPEKDKDKVTDVFAVWVGRFPTYRFVGFASYLHAIRPENLDDVGRGPTYRYKQHRLKLAIEGLMFKPPA